MSAEDVLRRVLQPRRRYVGARLQASRPVIDADLDGGAIDAEREAAIALSDVVGPLARIDRGFLPDLDVGDVAPVRSVRFGDAAPVSAIDFSVRPGAMHVGGRRFASTRAERILFQPEHLQLSAAGAPRADGPQRHLLFLRGGTQPVSATEDRELLEAAGGGADATIRARLMQALEVRAVEGTTCEAALAEVVAALAADEGVELDTSTFALQSQARLQMGFLEAAPADCEACTPRLEGRYLGAEAHTLRVMLATPDRFVWAHDDGAPLYRARLVPDGGGGATVAMLTPPKDRHHQPGLGTVVEVLPWAALLDNDGGARDEPVAARVGIFGRVDEAYEAGSGEMHAHFGAAELQRLGVTQWDPAHPRAARLAPSESGGAPFLYLRVWHRAQDPSQVTLPTSGATPLARTGLVPTFTGRGRPGDFWIVHVRPQAPDLIEPRALMAPGGAPPAGPDEVLAPVALLEWAPAPGGRRLTAMRDCRPRAPALTERRCDTFVVGPKGRGHFERLQAAVDALPAAGGQILLLPGTYVEEVDLRGRAGVRIRGCGRATVLRSPLVPSASGVLTFEADDGGLTVTDLRIEAYGQRAVAARGSDVRLERLHVLAGAPEGAPPAIELFEATRGRVRECSVEMQGALSDHAAIYVHAPGGATIEGCEIEARAPSWGGVHVAGGSRGVVIRDNRIRGGRGHGVTLGSVRFLSLAGKVRPPLGAGAGQSEAARPHGVTGVLRPIDVGGVAFPAPDEDIEDLRIEDNHIERTGACGISSLVMLVELPAEAMAPPLCLRKTTFGLVRAVIRGNAIEGCVLQAPDAASPRAAFAGIGLSEVRDVDVEDNRIEATGAEGRPCSGLHVLAGAGLRVANNTILGTFSSPHAALVTARAGVELGRPGRSSARLAQVSVRGNVVDQAVGPALLVAAEGVVSISKNDLEGDAYRGNGGVTTGPNVFIDGLGAPWESVGLAAGEPSLERWAQPQGLGAILGRHARAPAAPGGVSFVHNQVRTRMGPVQPGRAVVGFRGRGDVLVLGNQFACVGVSNAPVSRHVQVVAPVVQFVDNRAAERVAGAQLSYQVVGQLITLAAGDVSTHCGVVYGQSNHGNALYYFAQDNLHLLEPLEGGCEAVGDLSNVRRAEGPLGRTAPYPKAYVRRSRS